MGQTNGNIIKGTAGSLWLGRRSSLKSIGPTASVVVDFKGDSIDASAVPLPKPVATATATVQTKWLTPSGPNLKFICILLTKLHTKSIPKAAKTSDFWCNVVHCTPTDSMTECQSWPRAARESLSRLTRAACQRRRDVVDHATTTTHYHFFGSLRKFVLAVRPGLWNWCLSLCLSVSGRCICPCPLIRRPDTERAMEFAVQSTLQAETSSLQNNMY